MSPLDTLLFRCAICEREIRDYPDRNGRDRHLAPVCRMCESHWTERTGALHAGSMMDRRKARHLLALTNALHNTAALMEWNALHARCDDLAQLRAGKIGVNDAIARSLLAKQIFNGVRIYLTASKLLAASAEPAKSLPNESARAEG